MYSVLKCKQKFYPQSFIYIFISCLTSLIEFSEGFTSHLSKAGVVDLLYLTFQKALSQRSQRNFDEIKKEILCWIDKSV